MPAMPDVLAFSSGDYAVEMALREPPLGYPSLANPGLREDFGLSERGTLFVVIAGRADADQRSVIVADRGSIPRLPSRPWWTTPKLADCEAASSSVTRVLIFCSPSFS